LTAATELNFNVTGLVFIPWLCSVSVK
jgi:hypothetical protein